MAALTLGLPAVALAIQLRASAAAHRVARNPIPKSRTIRGVPEVGPLFTSAANSEHGCTASVVDSPHGDVLLTAAHCLSGSGAGMVFAPGSHNGNSPYGRWTVTAVHLAPGWLKSQDPQADFAFLTVAPQTINGQLREIEQVTGAYLLGQGPRAGDVITAIGYPAGGDNDAITCRTTVYFTASFPSFDCSGYVGGTSGGPWLVPTPRRARIVGVIGGPHQGGCVDSTSYSSLLTRPARRVYARAADHDTPDIAPTRGSDGC
jgi:hypothetical protein